MDNDLEFAGALEVELRHQGLEHIVVEQSGPAALARIVPSKNEFDCVFCASRLSEMPGGEFVSIVRAINLAGGPTIIMTVSAVDRGTILAALETGADDYITKPLDRIELWARLTSIRKLMAAFKRAEQAEIALGSIVVPQGAYRH
ncbi:response regulator [Limimaricola sp.]|uniref:response regulator n=1 Tax=Limimaricola sp. TaxID=2211665 RepID=UPI0025B9A80B|nr:response regulator [Limimaricola sp.]